MLTAFDSGKLCTIAYDRATGGEVWRVSSLARTIEPYHKIEGSPAASTPVTDGQRIVSYFGSCGLFCFDLSGNELWRHELPMAATPFDFGSGVSPILADGLVILVRDETKDPKIIALDAKTGKVVWERVRQSKGSFCTPVVFDTPRGKQIAAPGYGRMVGYDLLKGEETWSVTGMPAAVCASPVVAEGILYFAAWSPGDDFKLPGFDALIKEAGNEPLGYITSDGLDKTFAKGMFDSQDLDNDGKLSREEWDYALEYVSISQNSAFALKLGGIGDVTKSHVLWRQTKVLPYVPSGILYRGQYVTVKDGGIVTAYDAKSGRVVYQKRAAASGRYYASPVAANGCIYFACLDTGEITVLRAGDDQPTVLARNRTIDEPIAATPAIADDSLYVRTSGHLMAFSSRRR